MVIEIYLLGVKLQVMFLCITSLIILYQNMELQKKLFIENIFDILFESLGFISENKEFSKANEFSYKNVLSVLGLHCSYHL